MQPVRMLPTALVMPPLEVFTSHVRAALSQDFSNLKTQWENPSNIMPILTVIGGDIVRGSLAQLSSSNPRFFTPIAFSFGWVSYSFTAVLSSIGSRRLSPEPDCPCILVDASSRYPRTVRSWVLSRLVRDYELPGNDHRGLTVTFYRTLPQKRMSVPDRDWVYYSGLLVLMVQLGVAVIPGTLYNNWSTLILTCGGVLLSQLQASIPQWRKELWNARPVAKGRHEVVCLTKGNGSPYVMVIRSDECGLRMADLAAAREVNDRTTTPATIFLAILWLVHLFCMGRIDTAWFPLIIGAIGMFQNALASGARRQPGALGIHLEELSTIHEPKTFAALVRAEGVEKGVGIALIDIFFPGGLRPEEEAWKQGELAKLSDVPNKMGEGFEREGRSRSSVILEKRRVTSEEKPEGQNSQIT